jgi:hypothetical protein
MDGLTFFRGARVGRAPGATEANLAPCQRAFGAPPRAATIGGPTSISSTSTVRVQNAHTHALPRPFPLSQPHPPPRPLALPLPLPLELRVDPTASTPLLHGDSMGGVSVGCPRRAGRGRTGQAPKKAAENPTAPPLATELTGRSSSLCCAQTRYSTRRRERGRRGRSIERRTDRGSRRGPRARRRPVRRRASPPTTRRACPAGS